MRIKLISPLQLNASFTEDLLKYLPNLKCSITDDQISITMENNKNVISFLKKDVDGFHEILTDLSEIELGEMLDQLHRISADPIVSILGKSGFILPQYIHIAVKKGDEAEVKSLLEKKHNPNKLSYGETPLFIAISENKTNLIALLLDSKADANTGNSQLDMSALYSAVANKNIVATRLLLEHKADPNFTRKNGYSIINKAMENPQLELIKLLCENGLKEPPSNRWVSPLLVSKYCSNNLELTKVFLEHKFNPNVKNFIDECTILHLCSVSGNLPVINLLLESKANINEVNEYGSTPLYMAVGNNQTETALYLLSKKADPTIKTKSGQFPLWVAAGLGNNSVIDALKLLDNYNVNETENSGITPIYFAAQEGHEAAVQRLVEHKAQLTPTQFKYTPLYQSAARNHLNIVKILLQVGSDVNTTCEGGSAVCAAAAANNLEMVQELLKYKADPNIGKHKGETALFKAVQNQSLEIVSELIDAKADINHVSDDSITPLHEATMKSNLPIMRLLIQAKANVHAKTNGGAYAIGIAAFANKNESVSLLLENKADPLPADVDGVFPFYIAVKKGNVDLQRMLAPFHSNFTQVVEGETLLDIAIKLDHGSTFQHLLELKADPNIKNAKNNTALVTAVESNKAVYVKALLAIGARTGYKDPYRLVDYASHHGYKDITKLLLGNDEKAIDSYLANKASSKDKVLTVSEIRASHPAFSSMFENELNSRAINIIKQWRSKFSKVESKENKQKPISQKITLGFIEEPWGSEYLEHVAKIKSGEWTSLNFKDPYFDNNIYKALRLGKVTEDEMVTALLLYNAWYYLIAEYEGLLIREFSYEEEKGPYHPSSINYSTESSVNEFFTKIKVLPKHEQRYFTIDCNRKYEFYLITKAIERLDCFTHVQFMSFLKKLVAKFVIAPYERRILFKDIDELSGLYDLTNGTLTSSQRASITRLLHSIQKHYSDVTSVYASTLEKHSAYFATAIMRVQAQNPFLEISPGYDESEPSSPLLCRIIPTAASFKVLLEAIQGYEHVTLPFYSVGKFTPKFIRDLDENPQQFGQKRQMRPVELVHPNVEPNHKPHGFFSNSFELMMHDLNLHVMRNGSFTIKPFLRFLRQLLDLKGLEMSKTIWNLSDMDDNIGEKMRINKDPGSNLSPYIRVIILWHRKDFFAQLDNYDDNLILLFSMLIDEKKWRSYLDTSPISFMRRASDINLEKLEIVLTRLRQVLARYPNRQLEAESALLYIVAYRLQANEEGLNALDKLAQRDLETFFYWERNGGICFESEYAAGGEVALEKLTSAQIAHLCIEAEKVCEVEDKAVNETVPKEDNAVTPISKMAM